MSRVVAIATLLLAGGVAIAQPAAGSLTVRGSVLVGDFNDPLPYAFVGILSKTFEMIGQTATGTNGRFSIELSQQANDGYLMVQPPPQENAEGLGIYAAQPRIFAYSGETSVNLRLPAAGCIVLDAYDRDGQRMRWQDFRARGTFGDQFMYLTSLSDQALPAVPWPVFDQIARDRGQPRELGMPALVVKPGTGYVPQILFWDVPDYGRLLLRADNEGKGFALSKPGESCVLELNVELARTAVHQLAESKHPDGVQMRTRMRDAEKLESAPARAAAADAILADALRMRDNILVERARETIPTVRMGKATIRVVGAQGSPIPGATVTITQQSSDFLFGVFEGSPYNAKAFAAASEAGFNLATVLLGWGWTDAVGGKVDRQAIEQTFGIAALKELGFTVKAHGVVWLQDYGILPERTRTMNHQNLIDAMLAQEEFLLNALGNEITIWEAMNEPNVTNVVQMPRPMVHELLSQSTDRIASASHSLVNGAHEGDFGRKYALFGLDGSPVDDWNVTYSAFLEEASFVGSSKQVDIVGLQYYPGFRFNESFGGIQGPATTPGWFYDLMNRYAAFDRPVHITEFSLPSTYVQDSTSGYWREPWNETTQADYAEMIFTLTFAHPDLHSISWWDVVDTKSSVISGGLLRAEGSPKPIFERLSALLDKWTRHTVEGTTNAEGQVELSGFGGDYAVEVEVPGETTRQETVHIREREIVALDVSAGVQP
jgi:hypothetical protein